MDKYLHDNIGGRNLDARSQRVLHSALELSFGLCLYKLQTCIYVPLNCQNNVSCGVPDVAVIVEGIQEWGNLLALSAFSKSSKGRHTFTHVHNAYMRIVYFESYICHIARLPM